MNFWQRLQYLITGREEKLVAHLRPSWENTPTYAIANNFETLVREGYRRNELIYACIEKTAKTAGQINLILTDPEGEEVEEHPMLDLIHHPNDYMNESDFWAAVVIYQKLAGRAIFEIEMNNGGLPVALWPLRPDRIEIVQSTKRPTIDAYLYKVPGMLEVELRPEQVLDFPLFDPLDRFTARSPVSVAARVGDVDNAMTDHIKLIFEHGGMPAGIIKTTLALTDTQAADIRRRWSERYGGHENWLQPAVLDRDAEFQKIGMNLKDELGIDFLDARDEVRICMALDIPPIVVGAKAGLDRSTYSNYAEARRAWWEDTLLPMYGNLLDVVENRLLPKYGESNLTVTWDTTQVYAFKENVNDAGSRATAAWDANAITLNEFCAQVGLEEKGEEGEVYKNEMTTPPQLAQPTAPEAPEGEPMSEELEEAQEDTDEATLADEKALLLLANELKLAREAVERYEKPSE